MKKILTFLAVAIVAAASQAATVTWTSGAMYKAADAAGTWGTGNSNKIGANEVTAVYLIVDQATFNSYSGKAEDIYKDWSTLVSGAIRKSEVKSNGLATANWKDTTEIAKADGTIYALALYTYSHATYGDFYIAAAGSAFVNDLNEVEAPSGSGYTSLASNIGSWTPASAVPEPTTVALLALGLVAVGLKRKVA